MKLTRRLACFAPIICALSAPLAHATTYQWDVNGDTAGLGGAGTWDTTNTFWDTVGADGDAGTDATIAVTFTNADAAIFGGTAGVVTLGTPTTVNALTFNTDGYSLTGSTLTLAGTAPTITAGTGVTATISSVIAGTSLTKAGTGTLALSGTGSQVTNFSMNAGTTNITGGSMTVTNTSYVSAIGNTAGTTTLNVSGGALAYNGVLVTGNISGGTSIINQTGGTITVNGTDTAYGAYFGNSTGGTTTLNLSGGAFTVSGGNGHSVALSVRSANTLNLSGTANFTAPGFFMSYHASDLGFAGTVNLGDGTAGGTLTVSTVSEGAHAGGIFNFNGGTLTATSAQADFLRVTNTNVLGAGVGSTINNGGFAITIGQALLHGGVPAIDGGLIFQGSSTTSLSGANTYTGGTTISAGTIVLAANSTPTTGTVTSGPLGTGTVTLSGGTLSSANIAGTGTIANNIVATAATTSSLNAATSGTINLVLNGNITGSGNLSKTGSNSVILGGNNSGFTGNFTNTTSNTYFSSANAGSAGAAWVLTTGFFTNGLATTHTVDLGSFSGSGGTLNNGSSGTVTYSIGALGTATAFSGTITNSVGTTALTKVGGGTFTLSGANGYTGLTTVSAGVLLVNGSTASGSAVTVDINGTLGGTGTVSGTVNAAGTIAPGTSAGTLTTGATTLTGTLAIEVDGATADKLTSTGALNISGSTLTVSLLAGGFTQSSYVIAQGTSITGNFANVPSGYQVNIVSGGPGQQAVLSFGTPFQTWINSYFTNPTDQSNPAIVGPAADPDGDGYSNSMEFALGGVPNSGSDSAKIYVFASDSDDVDTDEELQMTLAVRSGTPAFTGSPSPSSTKDGFTYTIEGSTDLVTFGVGAAPVGVVSPGFTAPTGYEWRTFSLAGSNSLSSRGFMRVHITP